MNITKHDNYVQPKARSSRVRSCLEPGDVDFNGHTVYTCAAFDFGGTSGWSLFAVYIEALRMADYTILDNIAYWSAGEYTGTENSQAEQALQFVRLWPDAHLVSEDFILRTPNMSREVLSPVRIHSKFEFGLHLAEDTRPIITQQPALAKTTITDERLKSFGFWMEGQEHARDAIRHNLTWLRRAKEIMTVRTNKHPNGRM